LKWGAGINPRYDQLYSRLSAFDGLGLEVEPLSVNSSFGKLKQSFRVDHQGMSLSAVRLIANEVPELVSDVIYQLSSNTSLLVSSIVPGHIKGKYGTISRVSQLRAILSSPTLLALCDVAAAAKVNRLVDETFPKLSGVYIGQTPRTQPTDVAAGLALTFRKGLDDYGRVATAQADSETYYDVMSPSFLYDWFVDAQADPAVFFVLA
jgi:hypothetical protein